VATIQWIRGRGKKKGRLVNRTVQIQIELTDHKCCGFHIKYKEDMLGSFKPNYHYRI
jgi:hypothetical protein